MNVKGVTKPSQKVSQPLGTNGRQEVLQQPAAGSP